MRRPLVILVILALILSAVIWYLSATGRTAPLGAHIPSFGQSATPTASVAPTPTAYQRPDLQAGMIFPQYGDTAYSNADPYWSTGLREIDQQTGARWVEMTINFTQDYYDSSTIQVSHRTPTPTSLQQGIEAAHRLGKKVFIAPVISLLHNSFANEKWSGDITCSTQTACDAWFANYFQVYKPYLEVAQQTGAEQVAIGTELQTLEILHDHYWDSYIDNVASVYTGRLTYDMNFSSILAHSNALPTWLSYPKLSALGVSAYFSLASSPKSVPLSQIPSLWAQDVRAPLDAVAQATGKPIIISELGYRNDADALYLPFVTTPFGAPDPALQAAAFDAALQNIIADPNITGVFVWAWSIPVYAPNNLPAAKTLRQWYTSPKA